MRNDERDRYGRNSRYNGDYSTYEGDYYERYMAEPPEYDSRGPQGSYKDYGYESLRERSHDLRQDEDQYYYADAGSGYVRNDRYDDYRYSNRHPADPDERAYDRWYPRRGERRASAGPQYDYYESYPSYGQSAPYNDHERSWRGPRDRSGRRHW